MKKTTLITTLVALIIIAGGVFLFTRETVPETVPETVDNPSQGQTVNENEGTPTSDRMMAIEDYIRLNISDLAPEKATMGGTFYVTAVQAQDGKGTVSYEDGHNAYTADFTYTTSETSGYTINSFVIRK